MERECSCFQTSRSVLGPVLGTSVLGPSVISHPSMWEAAPQAGDGACAAHAAHRPTRRTQHCRCHKRRHCTADMSPPFQDGRRRRRRWREGVWMRASGWKAHMWSFLQSAVTIPADDATRGGHASTLEGGRAACKPTLRSDPGPGGGGGSVPAMHVTTLRDAAIAGAAARSADDRIPPWLRGCAPSAGAAAAGRGVYDIMDGVRASVGGLRAADARNPRAAEEQSACAAISPFARVRPREELLLTCLERPCAHVDLH